MSPAAGSERMRLSCPLRPQAHTTSGTRTPSSGSRRCRSAACPSRAATSTGEAAARLLHLAACRQWLQHMPPATMPFSLWAAHSLFSPPHTTSPPLRPCSSSSLQGRQHLRVRGVVRLVARLQRVQPHHRQELHPAARAAGGGGEEPQPPRHRAAVAGGCAQQQPRQSSNGLPVCCRLAVRGCDPDITA